MKPRWKRGVVLLQTLVMSVLLSMIAVMLMKWILSRYLLAARNYRATEAKSRSQGISADHFSRWNYQDTPNMAAIPTTDSMWVDGREVTYTRRAASAGSMQFDVRVDED